MATLKYSRQRESIKDYLNSTTEHPTADTVYLNVRKEFPNISLGTVYRNLNLLAEIGDAIKIPTPNGGDRFDGSKNFDGIIENHSMMFYGTCNECVKKQ